MPWLLVVLLSILIPACAFGVAGEPAACPATLGGADAALQRTYVQFRQTLESGPVAGMLGRPVSCRARADEGAVRLEYEFAQGARLEAQRDSAIELTEQRLTGMRLSDEAARALLKDMEQQGFGRAGCGIAWREPPAREGGSTPQSYALVYRGSACNCQGRLELDGGALRALEFRSAC